MGIAGLTDTIGFALLGRIRKGAPGEMRTNKKGKEYRSYGQDTDHFRCASTHEEIMANFAEAYGPEPKELSILLPYPTTDENFSAWMEEWTSGGLKRRCDSQKIHLELSPDGEGYTRNAGPCIQTSGNECNCKASGRLSVLLPDVMALGFFEVVTHSKWDIMEISRNLQAIESIIGSLQGTPLLLRREFRSISTPGQDGNRVRRDKWLIKIEMYPDLQAKFMRVLRDQAQSRIAGYATGSVSDSVPELEGSEQRVLAGSEMIGDSANAKQQFTNAIRYLREAKTVAEAHECQSLAQHFAITDQAKDTLARELKTALDRISPAADVTPAKPAIAPAAIAPAKPVAVVKPAEINPLDSIAPAASAKERDF